MASNNNTTLAFVHPVPPPAQTRLTEIVEEFGFAHDWDEPPVDLAYLQNGRVTLRARDVDWHTRRELITLGKIHEFSVLVHCEDHGDLESEFPHTVEAWDQGTGREIEAPAGSSSWEPMIPLSEALCSTSAQLKKCYALPAELIETEETVKS